VGFGVLNDISAIGLQRELVVGGAKESDWPMDRCQELIDTWFDIYKGVRNYMDRNRAYAAKYGKIIDMWGRVRWVPWAQAKTPWKKEEGLKQAGNTPIQSGAQGVIKRAMGKIQPMFEWYRRHEKRRVVPLIQVHDSLLTEKDKRVADEVSIIQKGIMESAAEGKMKIPLKVDTKRGENWGETKKVRC
jgi:DNA polymerase-1